MSKNNSATRPRLTKEDWANAALKAIAREGLKAVSVEPLAKRLGVTKGSFYWHFKTRNDLIRAAVERWEALGDQAISADIAHIQDPRARLHALFQAAFDSKNAHALLHHLASHHSDPNIERVIQRVTARRIASLTDMFAECGLNPDQAHHRALLAYAAYVGMFQIRATAPDATPSGPKDTLAFTQHLVSTLIPEQL